MPSRPATVALLALVAVAGCLGSPASTPTDATTAPATDAATTAGPTPTTDRTTTTRNCYYEGYEVEATPASPADVAEEVARPVSDLEYRPRRLVLAALANGSATTTVLGEARPLDDGDAVRRNGTYYRVERTTLASEIVVADGFELDGPLHPDRDETAYEAARAEAVAFENLPAPDRRAFLAGLPRGEELDRLVAGDAFLAAGFDYAFRNESARAASRLLTDGPHYVAFRDTYWRVAPTGDRESVPQVTYRYRLNRTADSAGAFGRRAVERYVVRLNESFGGEARDLLVRAVETGTVQWSGCEEAPPLGYESLARAVGDLPPDRGPAYVRYRGTLYRVTVLHTIE